jgi:hypothetical protein
VLETFTIATFSARTGETFHIAVEGKEPLNVALIEVTDLTSLGGPEAAKRERAPFSIVFRGAREIALPQRMYRMRHETIGDFEIFLVPIGPDREGMRYEAIFT